MIDNSIGYDIFGKEITQFQDLKSRFIMPPFSVLDSKSGDWQNRKRRWKELGIKSELGRDAECFNTGDNIASKENKWGAGKGLSEKSQKALGVMFASATVERGSGSVTNTSIFDPVLCEIIYKWFCPDNGEILDPFAGGSVRGIIANFLGYKYTGIDLRQEQVKANIKQAAKITPENVPIWYCGDSNNIIDTLSKKYDFIFSCPPYFDLEKYSDDKSDLSNMDWDEFLETYRSIIKKSCDKLKQNGLACFVVGEIRDKKGNYRNFVGETINAFLDSGAKLYNEIVLLTSIGTARLRTAQMDKSKKVVKVHQNVLVFKKP